MDASDYKSNIAEFSVAELSQRVRKLLESEFNYIRVRGEIFEVKRAASGHMYLQLRDAVQTRAGLQVVCWRSRAARLEFELTAGQDVIITGKLTAYAGSSSYQLELQHIELSGEGRLVQEYERLKRKLTQEGLFASERKRRLPLLPQRLGIITSRKGAVLQDLIQRIQHRGQCHVIIWPVAVQGEACASEIIAALQGMHNLPTNLRPDVIVIARGGGSLQDLWGFNDETLIRQVAIAKIPVVSAIGHETDTPLLDLVADLRAATPTAAAELIIPIHSELRAGISEYRRRLCVALDNRQREWRLQLQNIQLRLTGALGAYREQLQLLDRVELRLRQAAARTVTVARMKLAHLHLPYPQLQHLRQQLVSSHKELQRAIITNLTQHQVALQALQVRLGDLSLQQQLKRGFALVFDSRRQLVTASSDIRREQLIEIQFAHDRRIKARVVNP